MARDPLEARREALVQTADSLVVRVRALAELAWPLLRLAGVDPEASVVRLAQHAAAARVTSGEAENLRRGALLPRRHAKPVLARVALWIGRTRTWLDAAPPEAAGLARELRAALVCDLRRLVGTVAMLRQVLPMIRQREASIGPAEAVLADGDALLLQLGRLDDAALAAKAEARRATVAAQAATRALVADLRRLRADWSSAANHGPMPELELEEAKAAVATRPRRRRGSVEPASESTAG